MPPPTVANCPKNAIFSGMKPITFYAQLPTEERDKLSQNFELLHTLGDVVPWSMAHKTNIHSVLVQDEYTHDVIVPLKENLVVIFDTT
jgi:hypothetical protein